jgi:plastocyanin
MHYLFPKCQRCFRFSHKNSACLSSKRLRIIAPRRAKNAERQLRFGIDIKENLQMLTHRTRSNAMKRLNVLVRLTFWLAAMFAIVFLSQAQPGNKRLVTTQQKKPVAHAIHIVDQNGQPAVNSVPSGAGQIFDVTVAPGALLLFEPTWFSISVGDTVRWAWDDDGHGVTSGELGTADGQFCSPDDMNCDQGILSDTGTIYEHTFTQVGTYNYFCASHWAFGMVGMVNVLPAPLDFSMALPAVIMPRAVGDSG